MAKNNFADMLGTTQKLKATRDTKDTQDTRDTESAEDTKSTKSARNIYRLNLKLSGDLKQYLNDEAWRQRISITQLVNNILEAYKDEHPSPEGEDE